MSSATEQTSHGPENAAGERWHYAVDPGGWPNIKQGAGYLTRGIVSAKNAHRMAAADDLLEALIGLLVSRDDEAVSLAQAAIKKAEGR